MRTKTASLMIFLAVISMFLAAAMLTQKVSAQTQVCYDSAGAVIPCPSKHKQKQQPTVATATTVPSSTSTTIPTQVPAVTAIPTGVITATPTKVVIILFETATFPALPVPAPAGGSGGLPQDLKAPFFLLPAIQKVLIGLLIVLLLIGLGLGFRRFFGNPGKPNNPGGGSKPPNPNSPTNQFLKFGTPGDSTKPPGPPAMPSNQFIKLDTLENSSLPPGPPVIPSNQFIKIDNLGDGYMPPGPPVMPSNQFLKFETPGDSAQPPGPPIMPSDQFLKFENTGSGADLGGGFEAATMTVHDISVVSPDEVSSAREAAAKAAGKAGSALGG